MVIADPRGGLARREGAKSETNGNCLARDRATALLLMLMAAARFDNRTGPLAGLCRR